MFEVSECGVYASAVNPRSTGGQATVRGLRGQTMLTHSQSHSLGHFYPWRPASFHRRPSPSCFFLPHSSLHPGAHHFCFVYPSLELVCVALCSCCCFVSRSVDFILFCVLLLLLFLLGWIGWLNIYLSTYSFKIVYAWSARYVYKYDVHHSPQSYRWCWWWYDEVAIFQICDVAIG